MFAQAFEPFACTYFVPTAAPVQRFCTTQALAVPLHDRGRERDHRAGLLSGGWPIGWHARVPINVRPNQVEHADERPDIVILVLTEQDQLPLAALVPQLAHAKVRLGLVWNDAAAKYEVEIVTTWLIVGIPLAYGVFNAVKAALQLFSCRPPPGVAP